MGIKPEMSDSAHRPLLFLRPPIQKVEPRSPNRTGLAIGPHGPNKARQLERLGPRFDLLSEAIEQRRMELQSSASGISQEYILVFETNGPVSTFLEAVRSIEGMEWLTEGIVEGIEPDQDFYWTNEPQKPVPARLYMVCTSVAAGDRLLSLWREFQPTRARLAERFRPWRQVFMQLRDIRRWSARDRILDTNVLEDWEYRKQHEPSGTVPVEVELWFRNSSHRVTAEARIREMVIASGGAVLHTSVVEEICYHGMLVEITRDTADEIAAGNYVGVVNADDIQLFRPLPQHFHYLDSDIETTEEEIDSTLPRRIPKATRAAMLDGFPVENHAALKGRIVVDDPDSWSGVCGIELRRHGTAMASLILNGDMSRPNPIDETLYVRPIIRPNLSGNEAAPETHLWVDVIHRAVRRMFEGEGEVKAVAPHVKIINLSIGNPYQSFAGTISPLGRLIDWLSWKYKVLFIVSAGNHPGELVLEDGEITNLEEAAARSIIANQKHRKILSPAESINPLTIGALNSDEAGEWSPRFAEQTLIFSTSGMPAPYSALGRGFRLGVKPDIFVPGGRAVWNKRIGMSEKNIFKHLKQTVLPPGIKHAAPGKQGRLNETCFSFGTSNAAALATRAALISMAGIDEVIQNPNASHLQRIPYALYLKALLVHCSAWKDEAEVLFKRVLGDSVPASKVRDYLAGYLGYGVLDQARMLACVAQRATALGAGVTQVGETWSHRFPLPESLHAFSSWRRLTVSLAWFSPISPTNRKYKCISIEVKAPTAAQTPLRLIGTDVHLDATNRGTVQHLVLERDRGAINLAPHGEIALDITCDAEIPGTYGDIPYAIVVSLEVGQDVQIPLYEEVRAQLQTRVRL